MNVLGTTPSAGALVASKAARAPVRINLAGMVLMLAASQALTSAFNLARGKSIALALGPVGVGTVSLIDQLAQVAAFTASFALPYAGVKYLSKTHSQGHTAFLRAYRLFTHTLLFTSIGLALPASLVTLVRPQLWGQPLDHYAAVVMLALLSVPAVVLMALQVNVFAALQRPVLASLVGLSSAALTALGTVAGLLAAGLLGLYTGTLLAGMLVVAATLAYLRSRFGLPLPGLQWPSWREWREHGEVLRFCGMTYVISVGQPLAFLAVRYALLRHAGLAELGLFQSVYALAAYLSLLLRQSNAYYLTPLVNREGPPADKSRRALDFQRQMALCVTALALPLVLFPQIALAVLFSGAFAAAAPYLAIFALTQVVLVLTGVLQALLIGLDDLRTHLAVSLGAQLVLAGVAWLLAPLFGLWGVAVAFLATQCATFLACLVRLLVRHRTRLPRRSAAVMAYGLCLLGIAGWLGHDAATTARTVGLRALFDVVATGSLCFFLTRGEWSAISRTTTRFWPYRTA